MKLAIVHYHLRKGGVTKVIASALEALGDAVDAAVVLSSTESEEALPWPCIVIPELAYSERASPQGADRLRKALLEKAEKALGGPPDLWHVHNHNLGKNVNFPEALRGITKTGARTLLQIHDFSEDGRPQNYAAQIKPYSDGVFSYYKKALYPLAEQVGYAVLNGRDRQILIEAGVPEAQVFWLPNAVTVPPLQAASPESRDAKPPLILYPTRAIRRKNLGEILLMALFFPGFRYGTTLSPKNPQWASIYEDWISLSEELDLPVEFAMAEQPGSNFEELITEAHAMVTTSVGEGFGLAFLEPWLWGKPICGRDLPEITNDFKENGIQLPDLYNEWRIPLHYFDAQSAQNRFNQIVTRVYGNYGRSISASTLEAAWNFKTKDGSVDFGFLDECAQAEVLRKLAVTPDKSDISPPISLGDLNTGILSENQAQIKSAYGLEAYGHHLQQIYWQLTQAEKTPVRGLDPQRVLNAFLDVNRFCFLRT